MALLMLLPLKQVITLAQLDPIALNATPVLLVSLKVSLIQVP